MSRYTPGRPSARDELLIALAGPTAEAIFCMGGPPPPWHFVNIPPYSRAKIDCPELDGAMKIARHLHPAGFDKLRGEYQRERRRALRQELRTICRAATLELQSIFAIPETWGVVVKIAEALIERRELDEAEFWESLNGPRPGATREAEKQGA